MLTNVTLFIKFLQLFSILLSAYFVVPFLDTYRSIDVTVQGSLTGGNGHMIQQLGTFWGQYFAFTEKIDGYSVEDAATRFALTPGPLLITALLLGIAAVYLNINLNFHRCELNGPNPKFFA